jgi:hypothetical protein
MTLEFENTIDEINTANPINQFIMGTIDSIQDTLIGTVMMVVPYRLLTFEVLKDIKVELANLAEEDISEIVKVVKDSIKAMFITKDGVNSIPYGAGYEVGEIVTKAVIMRRGIDERLQKIMPINNLLSSLKRLKIMIAARRDENYSDESAKVAKENFAKRLKELESVKSEIKEVTYKPEIKEVAYKLDYDVEHYERCGLDWTEDLIFENWEGFFSYEYNQTILFEHPNPVIFQGYMPVVKHIDYLEADNNWNIMSRRMYETLLSVGDFPHRIIPVAIVDSREQRENWFDSTGNLRNEICLWNYLAVQMTEHLDIFDYKKSKYWQNDEDEPDRITSFSTYVFKVPENGLPPIFKMKTDSFYTFVSAKAREAMSKAKITGPRFISLQQAKDWVDNPIDLPDEV